jgi:hypothetical protein
MVGHRPRIIEHAVALKMYRGTSGGNYCYWNNGEGVWGFNPTNSDGVNYVNRVCSLVP